MKKIFIITCLLIMYVSVFANTGKTKSIIHTSLQNIKDKSLVWIYFKDKGFNSKTEMNNYFKNHKNIITIKALIRRQLRARELYTYEDLPLNKDYIDIIENMGIKVKRKSKWLNAISVYIEPYQLKQLSELSFIKAIKPVALYRDKRDLEEYKGSKRIFEDDSIINKYYYGSASIIQIEQININRLHNLGYTGKGVIIALFDTGVKVKYEDNKWIGSHKALDDVNIIYTYSFVDDTNYVGLLDFSDNEITRVEHGTKMLGLLAGYQQGNLVSPAFGASYMLFETEDPTIEIVAEEDNWIRAAEVAESLGADIISSSLGYKDWYPYSYMNGDSCAITIAADIAVSKGIVVVNAIGNVNEGTDRADTSIIAPADGDSVLTVGGVNDYDVLSDISATGPTYDKFLIESLGFADTLPENFRIKPEILALSDYPYTVSHENDSAYNFIRGTSASTALIAGGCALLLQAHPNWSPMDIRNALINTTRPPFVSETDTTEFVQTPNDSVGYGIADFYAALFYADSSEIISIEHDELLAPYPNPYSLSSSGFLYVPFKLINRVSYLTLSIYTIDGKEIYNDEKRDLLPGVYEEEESFVFDGKNKYGQLISPGLYFILLNSHFEKDIKKIMILP